MQFPPYILCLLLGYRNGIDLGDRDIFILYHTKNVPIDALILPWCIILLWSTDEHFSFFLCNRYVAILEFDNKLACCPVVLRVQFASYGLNLF